MTLDNNNKALKNIWVVTTGSRGDVQPYIAVCMALQERGYNMTLYTNEDFIDLANEFGVKAVSVRDPNTKLLYDDHPLRKGMMTGDGLTLMEGIAEVNERTAPVTCKIIKSALRKETPDLCLFNPIMAGIAWYMAIRHDIPILALNCQGVFYDASRMVFGMPTLPFGLHYYVIRYGLFAKAYDMQVPFLQELDPQIITIYPKRRFLNIYKTDPVSPFLVLFSPVLAAEIYSTAPSQCRFVGTTVIPSDRQTRHLNAFGGTQTKVALEDFLCKGPKPIYLGFGSMVSRSPEYMVEFCVRAIYLSGCRAVVLGGVAGLSLELLERTGVEAAILEFAKRNILFVSEAPHEWLFPKVVATIHHGGAGTTTAALRAGVPTVITPVFADQFDHAFLVNKLQVGVGFEKQLQKITWDELGRAIVEVTSNKDMAARARILGSTLCSEDGARRTADEVENYWREYCTTGLYRDLFPGKDVRSHSPWFRLASVLALASVVISLWYGKP